MQYSTMTPPPPAAICSMRNCRSRTASLTLPAREDLCFLAVFNRHGAADHTVTVARNFYLKEGAMASTVSHDCHNLALCYKDPAEGYLAAKTLIDCGGGFCTVRGGKVTGLLELPVAGLMSLLPLPSWCLRLHGRSRRR